MAIATSSATGSLGTKDDPFVQNDAVALKARSQRSSRRAEATNPSRSSTRFTWSPTWNRRQPVRPSRILASGASGVRQLAS